jgi:hypothetical protein
MATVMYSEMLKQPQYLMRQNPESQNNARRMDVTFWGFLNAHLHAVVVLINVEAESCDSGFKLIQLKLKQQIFFFFKIYYKTYL